MAASYVLNQTTRCTHLLSYIKCMNTRGLLYRYSYTQARSAQLSLCMAWTIRQYVYMFNWLQFVVVFSMVPLSVAKTPIIVECFFFFRCFCFCCGLFVVVVVALCAHFGCLVFSVLYMFLFKTVCNECNSATTNRYFVYTPKSALFRLNGFLGVEMCWHRDDIYDYDGNV